MSTNLDMFGSASVRQRNQSPDFVIRFFAVSETTQNVACQHQTWCILTMRVQHMKFLIMAQQAAHWNKGVKNAIDIQVKPNFSNVMNIIYVILQENNVTFATNTSW